MYELMSARCVMVNGGSGVLVNAMSDEYSYVLTAKHVVKNVDRHILNTFTGSSIVVIDVHQDPDCDCAIIQIEHPSDVQQETWSAGSLEHNSQLMVVGFPTTRRGNQEKIKLQDGFLSSYGNEEFVFTAQTIPPKTLIDGMSGGGVYYIHDNRAYLVGVEYCMDGERVTKEHYGRLKCHDLSKFEKIIIQKNLAPMVAFTMRSFSHFKDYIFEFNVVKPRNIEILQRKLCEFAEILMVNGLPTPYELMIKYNKNLLLENEHINAVQNPALWIAYFEFVIISAILDGVTTVDDAYLQDLQQRRRIIYSSANTNWLRNLSDILKSANQTLDVHGTIIINSPQENADILPPQGYLDNIIDDISSVPTSSTGIEIDNVSEDIYKTYIITHLKALRNTCVIDKEWEYANYSPSTQLQMFKEHYNEFIK